MRIDRRQFLKGASASAFLAGSGVLSLAARRASAFTASGRAVVLINFSGGNDYLNTVIPTDDVGANQRSVYEAGRPDLAVPLSALSATQIAPCAALGTGLALHPQMSGLATLFSQASSGSAARSASASRRTRPEPSSRKSSVARVRGSSASTMTRSTRPGTAW